LVIPWVFGDDYLFAYRTGATRVIPFSHLVRRVRHEDAVEAAQKAKDTDIIMMMTPSLVCHVGESFNFQNTF
jgi:hypothetical protein